MALPPGEHMDFEPGSYAQIRIPAFDCIDYDKDFDKSLIGDVYMPALLLFVLFINNNIKKNEKKNKK